MKVLLKILLWTIVSIVGLVLLVFALLQTDFGRGLVKDIALDALNGGIQGKVEVERLGGTLPFDVTLEGVVIRDPEGRVALSIAEVTADFHPLDLLSSRVHLSDIHVTRPVVRLFDEAGGMMLARAMSPRTITEDDTPSPWLVELEGIRLDAGQLEALVPGQDLALTELAIDLTLGVGPAPWGPRWHDLRLTATAGGDSPLARALGGRMTVATQGGLRGQTLVVERLDVVAGAHSLEGHGELDLAPDPEVVGALPRGTFVLGELRVDLASLPAELVQALPVTAGRVEGGGELRLSARGIGAALSLATPHGFVVIDAAAELVPTLGAYDATVRVFDARAPREAAWRLPAAIYDSRVDVTVVASGFGDPLGPGGTFLVDVEALPEDARRGHDLGRLTVSAERARADDPGAPPVIGFVAAGWGFELQPWLGLAGQPDLAGALQGVWAEGSVTLPPAPAHPAIAATFALDGRVAGAIAAGATPLPLSSPLVGALGSVRWEGAAPFGHVELTVTDLEAEQASAGLVVTSVELGDPATPERISARGVVRAVEVARLDAQAGMLEVPFDLALVDGLPIGDVGLVALHARAASHAVDRAFADLHVARDGPGLRVHGDARVTGLAIAGGAHRVGTAQLGIDYRLAATAPLDPLSVPSRGAVRGTLTQLRSGERAVAEAVVDLRLAAPDGLAGALHVSGTSGLAGVATPEVTARAADVTLDLTLAGDTIAGRAEVTAGDLTLPMLPATDGTGAAGRALRTATVEVRVERDGRLSATGSFAEPRGVEGDFVASGRLPRGRRPFTAEVERVRIKPTRAPGQRDAADLLVLQDLALGADGWVQVARVQLGNARGGLALEGRLHPGRGELDLRASATGFRVAEWLTTAEALSGFVIPGLPRDASGAIVVDGALDFVLAARGTLAAPTFSLEGLRLAGARVGERRDGDLEGALTLGPDGLVGRLAATWPDRSARKVGKASVGRFELADLRLPITLSLSPWSLRFDLAAPVSARIGLSLPDVRAPLAWAEAVVGAPILPDARGGASLDLALSGTGLVPRVDLDARSYGLAGWSGALRLTASPQALDPATWSARVVVRERLPRDHRAGRDGTVDVVRLDLHVPVPALAPLWDGNLEAFRLALGQGRSGLGLFIPRRALGDFPGLALLPDFAHGDVRVATDLRFEGHYPVLGAEGTIDVDGLGALGLDGGIQARFASSGERLMIMLFAAGAREGLLSGQIGIPRFGTLLTDPARFPDLLADKDFRVDLHTASMPTEAIELIDSELGATLERYFPRSIVGAHILARGESGGPEASVWLSIVSAAPQVPIIGGESAPVLDPLVRARALADQAYLLVNVKRLESQVRLLLLPESKIGSNLLVDLRANMGTKALLAGTVGDWRAVPIEGLISADAFALDGLVTALEAIVAPKSRGELAGKVRLDGTLGKPVFDGSLTADFGPLIIPNLSFDDGLQVTLDFLETRVALAPLELSVVPRSVTAALGRNEQPRPEDYRTVTVELAADVKSLTPSDIDLDGTVEFARFPLVNTEDIEVLATTTKAVRLTGTVAEPSVTGEVTVDRGRVAPDIAQGSVRSLGLPTDVRIVRGVPRPTREPKPRVVASKKTGVKITAKVVIPENTVLVEPHVFLPLGEVRALLEPYGTLDIATVQGEVAIKGDIRFPDDEALARLGLPKKQNSLYLYGKRFVLDSDARVRFNGDMATDPQISVTARYNIAHVDLSPIGLTATSESEVIVRVTGSPATQMRIDFGSNPGMDQSNILNIIALDQPAGGGEVGAAVPGQVIGAFLSMATLELTRELQTKLQIIDILRIDTNSTLEQARITMGKQLSDRIFLYTFVNVNADTERESVYEFSGEYRFSPVFSLVGKWGDIGELSLEGTVKLQP
ncbi:MAG: translocation/assembly module TamB domain-containing protein [Deltaproteobacteria bacterium]|nr:translocation/assembly module TamB domain-containing protein [Deltaproteobacteria bacterium]